MDDVKSPTRSPSEILFGSLLVYAPQGTSTESVQSQQVARHIKNSRASHVERVGLRIAEQIETGMFGDLLGTQVTLVPVPRSSPTVEHMHWPALRICSELEKRGLCKSVERLLERHTSVAKSALVNKGAKRPSPADHEASLRCLNELVPAPASITLVDDVVTRGSTLLGCAWTLAARFPDVPIRALAVIRTMSKQEITNILSPIESGRIYLRRDQPRREP
jgi:hypothetical protein